MKIIISPYPQYETLSWFNIYLIFKISYKTNDFRCKCGRGGSGAGSMGNLEPVSLAIVRKKLYSFTAWATKCFSRRLGRCGFDHATFPP